MLGSLTGRVVLSVAAGLAWWLSLPNEAPSPGAGWLEWPWLFGPWLLGPIGVAGVHLAGRGQPPTRRLVLALATAAGLYVPGLWWVIDFHAAGYVLLVGLQSTILALALTLAPSGRGRPWGLPLALALGEAVRARFPFEGLPLTGLDLGQVGGPLAEASRLGGPILVVTLLGLAGVALAEGGRALAPRLGLAHRVRGRARPGVALATATVAVAGVVAGMSAPDGRTTGELVVAAVQGGGPRGLRAVDTEPGATFEAHVAASAAISSRPELVLWPEDVLDVAGDVAESPQGASTAALARRLGVSVVAGVVEDTADGKGFRNAAVAWGPDGTVVDRTEKVHRVPFGEYIPFRWALEAVVDLSVVPRDAVVGEGPGTLDTEVGTLAVAISFEVFFPHRTRAAVGAGGELLVVPTNASSYRRDQVPAQEVAAAQLRAIETGRWVVQAAPTGYSAFVNHRGRVTEVGPLGDRAVLESTVQLRAGRTPFLATGPGPWVTLVAVGLAASWLWNRKVER